MIEKKEFAATALDPEYKVFIVYVAALSINSDDEVHPSRRALIAHLKADEALIKILSEYTELADVFLPKLAAELPKHMRINDHAIKLVDDCQPPYGPIYSLRLVELGILKAYIKYNLTNSFIRSSKSPTKVAILFDKNPDNYLKLCVNY